MLIIKWYEIVNGSKSDKIPFSKILKDKKELDELREYLEGINHCWRENKTITGIERKREKDIMITYETH